MTSLMAVVNDKSKLSIERCSISKVQEAQDHQQMNEGQESTKIKPVDVILNWLTVI